MTERLPLPEPKKYFGIDAEPDFSYFTADQMHEYAAAAYRAGLEAAAQAAGPDDSYRDEWFAAKADAVKRIRALELTK